MLFSCNCLPVEIPIEWNQRGPQGEQGLQGEQGPPGSASDLSNLVPQQSMSALRPAGQQVTGGGYEYVYDQDGCSLLLEVSDRRFQSIPGVEGRLLTVVTDGSPLTADVFMLCKDGSNNIGLVSQCQQFGGQGDDDGDG